MDVPPRLSSFSPMLIEWLKESWLLASAQMQHSELRSGVLLLTLLHSPLRYIPPAATRLLTAINRDQLQQDFAAWTKESAESVDLAGGKRPCATETGDTLLARYAKNMTADARNGRLDPVLCRNYEIDPDDPHSAAAVKTTRWWWAKRAWAKAH